ncbi:DHH family phosphoesterase [Sulfurimonas sp.]|uniref:DHH family phosphoesterase n=1 Tax=Sulfurimonas sp. TaxID=2022749 RepID=UPI0026007B1D|nr:DHH family phosphoesterase [Sulfurimonas sp.]MDD5158220.1 DHH family phosphoesterase [Sulfurimonas sp.]
MNEIVNKIENAKHIVVISHIAPDADSISSASAMYTFILQKHKKVSWFCKSKNIDRRFSFIPWIENIRDSFPASADLAISLDCGDKNRLGFEPHCELINIDHHESNTNFATLNLVDKSAISTTEVLFNFFKQNEIKINKKMATSLYAGLLDDSDGFLHESVDGTTFAVALELIASGAELKTCNKQIMKNSSLSALRLKGLMFREMSLEFDARVAVFCVSKEDITSCKAELRDCEGALEESLHLHYVEIALLVRENSDSTLKCSIRSCSSFDSLKIAQIFDGGGHKSRAGFSLGSEFTIEQAKEKILNLIKKDIQFEKR